MPMTSQPTQSDLRDFLMLPYGELEELNLPAKQQRKDRVPPASSSQEERLKYLTDEKRIKAVTVLFSDLEGRLHMLDYDKKFLLKSHDNLTFDGSSIRGFTRAARERPAALSSTGARSIGRRPTSSARAKCSSSATSSTRTARRSAADMRGMLKKFASDKCYAKDGYTLNAANEIEGFLFEGLDAERHVPRDGQVRVRQHRRLLSLAARRSAAQVHRHGRRSAARDGLREREGPSRSRAVAVRDQLQLRRSRRGRRSDPALQADLPPGRDEPRHDRQLPAQAGRRRQRQRHAHQRLGQQGRQEPVLGPEGRREAQRLRAGSSSTAS